MTLQEEFEAHFRPKPEGPSLDLTNSTDAQGHVKYLHPLAEGAWWGWREARRAQEAPSDPATHLLTEALAYWEHANAKHRGAVQWITGEGGELLIYTRGEYRQRLLAAIDDVGAQEAPSALQEITDYVKGIYAFIESTSPAGFADEAFRLPPAATRAQTAMLYAAQGNATGEHARPARQNQGARPTDGRDVGAQEAPSDARAVPHPVDQVQWWADAYDVGGHGIIVEMLRSYAAMLSRQPAQPKEAPALPSWMATRESFAERVRLAGWNEGDSGDGLGKVWIALCGAQPKDALDAARYRWLTEDHAEPWKRALCRDLWERGSVRSYSATSRDIDAAMAAAPGDA